MGSTNYTSTFIRVADDCPVAESHEPPVAAKGPTIASLQFELLSANPYQFTSDELLFEVHAIRHDIGDDDRAEACAAFFAKSQACLRASPLPKKYGWGIHHDGNDRVALVPLGSPRYDELLTDTSVRQLAAMRSKRA